MMVNAGGITPVIFSISMVVSVAEGLLTFGLGGLAIVYLLAPALDNLLSRIDTRKLTVVAVVLLAFYCVDQAYSAQHPNIGAGITDYKGSATSQDRSPYPM